MAVYKDSTRPISERVDDLISRMSLAEKIGQTTLVAVNHIDPQEVTELCIGAILSGGGGNPENNSPSGWYEMVQTYRKAGANNRLGIPIIYGADAVHGHSNLYGAVIFPHNIGLGAAGDADLVRRVARATAVETYATGVRWNYAPTLAVPQDIRWGRSYEGFAQDPALVAKLGKAYVEGLQGDDLTDTFSVLATLKHYVADGATSWGTPTFVFPVVPALGVHEPLHFMLDQGDAVIDEETLRQVHLAPYLPSLQAGTQMVMASFSSWNGTRLHANRYLLTDVLKGELGFSGFVVSDWEGVREAHEELYTAVVNCFNAGIDMTMISSEFRPKMGYLRQAVKNGDVPLARLDDAVRRILTVKMRAGLFDNGQPTKEYLAQVGSAAHRSLAREAVARSLVLLKNDSQALPLDKSLSRLRVAGAWADDIGLQCGGWTIEWQGKQGEITQGSSMLAAVRAAVSSESIIDFDPAGDFDGPGDDALDPADAGLVFVGEQPYAEGFGDRADLMLDDEQVAVVERMRQRCRKLVVVIVSGRPLIITDLLPLADAIVAAWLPGSEGQGVADVLFGDVPFSGKLSFKWPRSMDQIPLEQSKDSTPLFPLGYGLAY